jgi:hypothetical protein
MGDINSQEIAYLTPKQLTKALKIVSLYRPAFIWGPPGIGKSYVIRQFAKGLGLPLTVLLGSQVVPEDILGIPQVVDGTSRYCPPSIIARHVPYCLFLDEFNGSSPDVQKVFYNLIHERRIGEYVMPKGSIVIAAGNRKTDYAHVNQVSSALINRMVHIYIKASVDDWVEWAKAEKLHPLIIEYIIKNPDHLMSPPDDSEEPFSTPRSWHILSDALCEIDKNASFDLILAICMGAVTPIHARNFFEFSKDKLKYYSIYALLNGDITWPTGSKGNEHLAFLAHRLRKNLVNFLPKESSYVLDIQEEFIAKSLVALKDLYKVNAELAKSLLLSEKGEEIPNWYIKKARETIPYS